MTEQGTLGNTDAQTEETTEAVEAVEDIGSTENLDAALANLTSAVDEVVDAVESEIAVEHASTDTIAELFASLKNIEDSAEDFRKGELTDELRDRIEIGESYDTGRVSLTRIESHRKSVTDDAKTLRVLTASDVDPSPAVSMRATTTHDLLEEAGLDPEEHIGKSTYDYFRS